MKQIMYVVGIIIALAVALIIYLVLKRSGFQLTIFTLFVGLWLVILLLGKWNLYNLYEASEKFYFLLFLGIISWLIGFFLYFFRKDIYAVDWRKSSGLKITLRKYGKSYIADDFDINVKVIWLYIGIISVFTLMILMTAASYLLRGYSYSAFHRLAFGEFDETLFPNLTINTLYGRLMYPIVLAMLPIVVISGFSKKTRIPCLILGVIIFVYCMIIGRRFPLLYLAFNFVMALPFFKLGISKKQKRILLVLLLAMTAVIILLTAWRKDVFKTGDWSPVFASFYRYLNLCLPVGDYWIQYIDNNEPNTKLYGYATFNGIISNMDFVVRQMGSRIFFNEYGYNLMNAPQDNYIQISNDMTANAFTTWIYQLYLDFRIVGVIVGSFFFGLVSGYMEKLVFTKKNILGLAFYMLLAQAVFKSFVRWEFSTYSYTLAFIYLIPVFKLNSKPVLLLKWR